MRATYVAHPILDFITLIIFCEMYKVRSSSLCSFLQSPVASSLADINLLSVLSSNAIPDVYKENQSLTINCVLTHFLLNYSELIF